MENFTTVQIILIILIPATISAIPPLIAAITARKTKAKERAEIKEHDANAAQKISDAYDKIVADLQDRITKTETREAARDETIEKLTGKVDELSKRVTYLETGVRKLVKQVKDLGGEPVFDVNGGT
jgi:uncharacterized coiled-coil protein SlyX